MALDKKMVLTGATCLAAAVCFAVFYYVSRGTGTPTVELTAPTTVETTEATEATTEAGVYLAEFGQPNDLTGLAKTLLRMNPDTVGWIRIENTKVDYPIVQSEDNDYYLDTGFDHKPNRAGAVFMDYRDVFGFDVSGQSDNIVIYGHNMANNTMFGSLRRYRQDYTYYETNQYIDVWSNYDHYSYVIFGLVITDGSAEAEWRYWDMEEFATQQEFEDYVSTVRRKNLVDIDVDVQYGDQLLTLSTCYSDADDSRFLVIARKMREGETSETLVRRPQEATEKE